MSAISYPSIPSHSKMSSSRTYAEGSMSNGAVANSTSSAILGSYSYHHLQQPQVQSQVFIKSPVSSPSSSCNMQLIQMNPTSTSPPLNCCSSPRARKNSKESIHSGHFMISEIDEDACEPVVESTNTVHESDIEQGETLETEQAGKDFSLESAKSKQEWYKYGPETDPRTVTIDKSLSKLLQCMSIAYSGKLTSPKWKTFKGLKLRPKDKIRLNNIIWRCWHMQYVTGMGIQFCQFATTLDVHNKPEAILLEGKYWKRGTRAVKAEYQKWRMYYREKCYTRSQYESFGNSSFDLSSSFSESDLRSSNSMTDSFGFDDTFMSDQNSLWSSLVTTPNSFGFPSSKEINRSGFGADCIQPCLSQLQPPIYDFMDFDDILSSSGFLIGNNVSRNPQVSILPTLQEEPPMDCSASDTAANVPGASKSVSNDIASGASSSMHVLPDISVDSSSPCIQGNFQIAQIAPAALNNPLTTQYLPDNINNITASTASSSSANATASSVQLCTQINGIYDCNKKVNSFISASPSDFTFTPPIARVSSSNSLSPQQQQSQQFTNNQVTNDQKPYLSRRSSSNPNRSSVSFTSVANAEASESRFLMPQQPLSLKSTRSIQQQQQQQQQQLHHSQIQQSSVNSNQQQQQSQSQSSSMSLASASPVQPMYLSTASSAITSTICPNAMQQVKSSNNVSLVNSQVNNSNNGKVPFERSSSLPIYQSIEFMPHNPLVTSPSPLAPYQSSQQLTNLTDSVAPAGRVVDNLFIKSVAPVESTLAKDSVIAQLLSSPTPALSLSRSHSNQSVLLHPQSPQQQQQQSTGQTTYQTAPLPHSKYLSSSTSVNNVAVTVTPYVPSRITGKETRVRFSDDSAYSRGKQSTNNSAPVRKLSSPARICSNHPAALPLNHHLAKDALVPHASKVNKKGNQDKMKYQEHRRVCHINAEQKRRCNIKNGFDTLRAILPCINQSASAKISKAQMLQKAAEHIQVLKAEWQEKQSEYETWKKEIDTLNQTINVFQSQLPATGAPVGCQRTGRAKEMFRAYVQSRTQENWKFFIFSQIMEPLLESYDSSVSTSSAEELRKSTHLWLDQNCSLVNLRKGVLNSLRHLSTTSSILTNPSALPGEALQAVASLSSGQERDARN